MKKSKLDGGALTGAMSYGPKKHQQVFLEPINVRKKEFMESMSGLFDVAINNEVHFQVNFAPGIFFMGKEVRRKNGRKK